MKKACLLLVAFACAFAPFSAEARARKKKAAPPTQFEVSVPTSEVDIASAAQRDEEQGNVAYDFTVSTWSPRNFTRPSFLPDVLKFKSAGLPMVSLTRIAPIRVYDNGAGLHWRAGLSYAKLEREGLAGVAGAVYAATQTLNLVSVALGAEYRAGVLWNLVQPFAYFELRPSYLLGPRSPFEEPVNEWGLPFNAGAGLLARPAFLQGIFGLGDGSLGLGAHYMFGSVDASSLAGFGAQAFLQIVL
jgi:hypothetical protein